MREEFNRLIRYLPTEELQLLKDWLTDLQCTPSPNASDVRATEQT